MKGGNQSVNTVMAHGKTLDEVVSDYTRQPDIKDDTVKLLIELRIKHNNELQLMDALDQLMEHYHGIGIGVPLVDGNETRRALSRFMEKWGSDKTKNITE